MNLQECITLESQMASKNYITPFKYYIPWHFILLTFIHWKLLLHWEKYSYLIHLNSWDLFSASWPILVSFHIIFLTLCPSPHYTNMAFRFLLLLESMQSKLTVTKRLKIYIYFYTLFLKPLKSPEGRKLPIRNFSISGWLYSALKWPEFSNSFLSWS